MTYDWIGHQLFHSSLEKDFYWSDICILSSSKLYLLFINHNVDDPDM